MNQTSIIPDPRKIVELTAPEDVKWVLVVEKSVSTYNISKLYDLD